ncbi:SIMPL domain-containing protein [Tepidimonas sp.]|uniref:SIMPL domain-containing protein n=1 Tax=Tepidimonas sp. TaxID=2002775 RepID=UPI002FE25808
MHLSARAQQRVPHDWLAVTVAARQQGADPAAVQAQLARVLDGALAQVRPLQCPGQLEASSAGVQVQPRYGREGQIVGWQGSAELLLQGRDMGQVASVAAQLPGLVITGLQLSLSRDTIARAEAALREQAIAAFRQQALEVARAFGYAGYALGEVHVSAASPDGGPPRPLLRAQAMAAAEAAPVLTVEPGQTTLEVTVSGSIRLTARP